MAEKRVTVCICTYNRADRLRSTLKTLLDQQGLDWRSIEILIIDNNSSDGTRSVVDEAAGRCDIRCVTETKQGLSNARNRALAEFTGEWIIFTDDDVLLDAVWLKSYLGGFEVCPQAEYAGGRILPYWADGQPPKWFTGERLHLIDGLLVWYDLGEGNRIIREEDPEPFGASFALRRSLLNRLDGFRVDLGVSGKLMGRGEETEYLRRAKHAGATGVYVHSALCHHIVDLDRFTINSLYRHGIAKGYAHRAMTDPTATGSIVSEVSFLFRGIVQLLKGRRDRLLQCIVNAGIQRGLSRSKSWS